MLETPGFAFVLFVQGCDWFCDMAKWGQAQAFKQKRMRSRASQLGSMGRSSAQYGWNINRGHCTENREAIKWGQAKAPASASQRSTLVNLPAAFVACSSRPRLSRYSLFHLVQTKMGTVASLWSDLALVNACMFEHEAAVFNHALKCYIHKRALCVKTHPFVPCHVSA